MKKRLSISLLTLFLLFLTACGQGESQVEQEEPLISGNDTEDVTSEQSEVEGNENEVPAEESSEEELNTEGSAVEEPESQTIHLFFSDDQVMDMYFVERSVESDAEQPLQEALELWIAGPTEEGLVSLVPEDTTIQSVEIIDGTAHVSFSENILEAQVGSGTEEMLLQQVALIMEQFGYPKTQLLIDGEVRPQFFGHIDTSQPIVADSPDNYEKKE
ncbi:GerMN domain-containing protein [Bacillus suaedae]|uniref:GerMN domain-containing protein n=1 Tax=Halalkalibacter suaedae TaxID=2822140 RepID=A0A940WSX3_9BACI|nr:GerMN domain-containing protein [Bacillus suaedae]MBP3949593.1 GerMN domain-containing protein [Bacillus suaedae]